MLIIMSRDLYGQCHKNMYFSMKFSVLSILLSSGPDG